MGHRCEVSAKRAYYALDMYLEHPFDGKWQARIDYTFSCSYGNTEGQTRSDIGQTDICFLPCGEGSAS